ncbi:MAG: hypothetical protein KC680_02750 [Candidatus Peregrinibacteria bacterium]|nr:hypothetical protein [Candidatus Peregrinibacteria bacterium]MCB9808548.1 hypothetical protein [Candidatus Peribacteria bacterium]
MIHSVLVAYFLHQFQTPVTVPYREDKSVEYIRTVEQRGALTVTASTAKAGSIAPGSTRVEMLKLRLSASCADDIPIQTITIQRRGLGENSDISAVYALHRGVRISQARSVEKRDGLLDLSLRNVVIPKCTEEDISVYADISENASPAGEHTFELKGIDAKKATVRIDQQLGDFTRPQRTAGPPVGQISIEYLKVNERVHYGSRQRLGRFTLSADNKDDHYVYAMTFTNSGSARNDDLKNIFLEFRNRKVSDVATSLTGDAVRLTFNPPLVLQKNQTLQYSLRGDIRASRSRTIQLQIEESADIEAAPKRGR